MVSIVCRAFVFGARDRLADKALGLVGVAPAAERHPLSFLEVLIVRKEMLDLG